MYLVYLGESGNTGVSVADSNQPHHVHVGLLIHESQSISINGEFNALCRRHFGRPLGEAGTPKELRPSDVYQGRGAFVSWPVEKRSVEGGWISIFNSPRATGEAPGCA